MLTSETSRNAAPTRAPAASGGDEATPVRPDRPEVLAFVADAATEIALRDALSDVVPAGFDIRRSSFRGAIAALRRLASPHTLIIDISGEEQPFQALEALSHVVEPSIRVLLIGDRPDVDFYRQVTRGLGVMEYVYKPLQREIIARHFAPLLLNGKQTLNSGTGGHAVSITGVNGGVGASTIAASLAWYFGVEQSRRTVLLDSDLHRGTCAMLVGAASGSGLRAALEAGPGGSLPEHAIRRARERLDVLAGEEALDAAPACAAGAGARLMEVLRRRYNFVVVNLPFTGQQLHRELMRLTHRRVLVIDPTLAGLRNALQMLELPNGPLQAGSPILVLNRLGRPGTLTRGQIEKALKLKVDVVLPDLPDLVCGAAIKGEAAVELRSGFRNGMLRLAREVALLQTGGSAAARTGGLRQLAARIFGSLGPSPAALGAA